MDQAKRDKFVNGIFESLKSCYPLSGELDELKQKAARIEGKAFQRCTSLIEYKCKISEKVQAFQDKAKRSRLDRKCAAIIAAIIKIRKEQQLIKFSELLEISGVEDKEFVCPICLDSLEKLDQIIKLRNCSHVFHSGCLDMWFIQGQLNCPYCKCDCSGNSK